MLIPILILTIVLLLLVAALLFGLYGGQRSGVSTLLHQMSSMERGQYGRRVDPLMRGKTGELARMTNLLAEDLESRGAQAQQDKDHLVSLLALLDHTNEIAFATDNMDVLRLANTAAARVLERPVDQLLGRHIDTVIHHPDLRALYKNAFSSSGPVSAQIALQIPGRTLHCQATAATIYHGSHYRGTLLVLRDVTEIARTLQMKSDFATNASHELRTPLAAIRAAVETIRESGPEDRATIRRCAEIINNHVLRLQLMVQDLLDLSRAEDSRALVRWDRIDLELVCEALAASYGPQLGEKKLQLRIDLASNARTFKGDDRLLTLILKNLLDNAIKFTSQGTVTIRSYLQTAAVAASGTVEAGGTRLEPENEVANAPASNGAPGQAAAGMATATVAALGGVGGGGGAGGGGGGAQPLPQPGAGDSFVLEVSDSGIGIPAEDQERVFERFYTVNRSRGGADRGTGLGLSIVKHAVNALHGNISLVSILGQGTTIRCVFPLTS